MWSWYALKYCIWLTNYRGKPQRIPDHAGVESEEKVYDLGRAGTAAVAIIICYLRPFGAFNCRLTQWNMEEYLGSLNCSNSGCTATAWAVDSPSCYLVAISKRELNMLVGVLKGHLPLRHHIHYTERDVTPEHYRCECLAFGQLRRHFFHIVPSSKLMEAWLEEE